jgi:competence protein ComEC
MHGMRHAPLLVPAIAALLAIVAEQHGFAWCALAAGAACALAYLHDSRAWPTFQLRAVSVALVLGCLVSALRGHPVQLTAEQPTARYNATVIGDVRDGNTGLHGTALELDGIGTVRATLREHIVPGDRVLIRGRLEPFDEPRNPGEPSMREIERDNGFVARLAAARLIARLAPDPLERRAWAARLRASASARIRAVIPEPSATILAGMLWGERGTLPDDVHDAFQTTGTVHVLVTAGLHLGIIAALVAFGLGALGLHRIASCSIAFVVVIGYTWFSGAHLPSERAAAMIGIALCARACGARIESWNALAVAALIVAAIWPVTVTSASFAMSFSCVAAIVLFATPFTELLAAIPMHERFREAIALTCATQLGTWPLTAAMFSSIAPFAMLANAVVVPMMGAIIPLGLATLAIPAIAPIETLLLIIVERLVRTLAVLPGAAASIATPAPIALCLYDALAITAALLLHRKRHVLAAVAMSTACAIIIVPAFIHERHGLIITHLDVGQADAAVIRTPNDHIILIDTGGELERAGPTSNAERAGARIVLGYLRRVGIQRIDLMILTHPHGDHVGGAAPIMEAMPVGMIFDSGQAYSGRAYRDAMAAARSHGVPVVLARRGMRWSSGDGVMLDVLAPSMPFLADTGDDVNENSVVAMLRYGSFSELFMGDAGEASETRLLAGGRDLQADAVKVGHHGSRYASTSAFVAAVDPRIAIVSVGRHNTFGHPAPATIEAWSARGADVVRTDQCGAISVVNGSAATMLRCNAR